MPRARLFMGRPFAVGLALATLLIAAGTVAFAAPRYSKTLTSIEVRAAPVAFFDNRDPARTRFGALEFRGGLALTSSYEPFGGISAIHVDPDGSHFLALTDNGSWLRGRTVYDGDRPVGIADAEMAPILGPDGRPRAARF